MNRSTIDTPMMCSVCQLAQVPSPSGMTCANGHGGAEGIPLADHNARVAELVRQIPQGHIQHAVQCGWCTAGPHDAHEATRVALASLGWKDLSRSDVKALSFWFLSSTPIGRMFDAERLEPAEEKDGSDATTA